MKMRELPLLIRILIAIISIALLAGVIYGGQFLQVFIQDYLEEHNVEAKGARGLVSKQSYIVINEIMASNDVSLLDGDGDNPDWIELYNASDYSVGLKNAGLSTDISDPYRWEFPDITIEPGEYLIIFASGKNVVDTGGYYHTNFKLNVSEGETIFFTSSLGVTMSTLGYPPLDRDISYGYSTQGEGLYFFNHPTPGEINSKIGHDTIDFQNQEVESDLKISEYMTSNKSTLYDEFGNYSDWIEITNFGDEDILLDDYFLSDDVLNFRKFRLPSFTIAGGESVVVFASGQVDATQNIHVSLSLGAGEVLTLSNKYSEVLDQTTLMDLKDDISYGLVSGIWYYFSIPTPGAQNDTHYFEEMKDTVESIPDIYISETMTKNTKTLTDSKGNYNDWIEITNSTNNPINIVGYYLSNEKDNPEKFVFPDFTIPANGQKIIFFSREVPIDALDAYVPFSLGSYGEKLSFISADGKSFLEYDTGYQTADISSGLTTLGKRVFYTQPSPDGANSDTGYIAYTPKVEFSIPGGEVNVDTEVTLFAEDATIYYTLNGSVPDKSDNVYYDPIKVTKPTVIRAIAIKEGLLPSSIQTMTYIAGVEHELPIVSLSTESDNMYGDEGLYMFPYRDIEQPVHFELFETTGLALSFDAGFEVYGNTSQGDPQKSFAFHLRNEYGLDEINYPIFEGNEVSTFKHFLLRTSGQDANFSKVRDSFTQTAVQDVIDVDTMDSKPCVVYINGRY